MKKSIKTNAELLADLLKSNQARKAKLTYAAGFKTVEEYKLFLKGTTSTTTKTTSKVKEVIEKITSKISSKKSKKSDSTPTLDMVIAFDTTGSMSSYIQSVKKHVEVLVNEMFSKTPGLKIKIVAFGDYCDMQAYDVFGAAYQESALTNNVNDLIKFIKHAKNTSGGDGDEFYELVIQKITNETPWRKGAKKSILLIGDANAHKVGYNYPRIVTNAQIDWKKECKNAAKLGIQIDTLSIDHYTAKFYKEISSITNGVSLPFKSASKISNVIEGLAYARTSKKHFKMSFAAATASGDEELIGAYKSMSSLL